MTAASRGSLVPDAQDRQVRAGVLADDGIRIPKVLVRGERAAAVRR